MSLFYFFDDSGVFAAALCSAAVHELGHLLAIGFIGARISRLGLELTGALISYDNSQVSYSGEAFIAAMGPVFGMAFAIIMASLAKFDDNFLVFAGVSFCLSIFNLLPARNLDGGMILHAMLSGLKNQIFAERVLCVTTCFTGLIIMVLGCYVLILTGSNFTILLVGVWILFDFIRMSRRS